MYQDIETRIIERLKAKLPQDAHVQALRELTNVGQMRQFSPAAWVIYDGYRVGQTVGHPQQGVQQILTDWYVVVSAKASAGNGAGTEARNEASDIAQAVIQALIGHDLGGSKYLRLSDAPGASYDAGYCEIPLAFTVPLTLRGQP